MPKWQAVRTWLSTHRTWIIVAALLLFIDRATKVWALQDLAANGPVVWGKYLWLNYVENTGMAFGLFQNANAFLAVVMLAVIGYILYSWKDIERYGTWAQWGGIFILTGALGNLYDRLTLGFVVDFIDLRVWPVFNGADSFITIGAVCLGISLLGKQEKK